MIKNLSVNNSTKIKLSKNLVHKLVTNLRKEFTFSIENLAINFVESSYIHTLNKKYLGYDCSTDVITFNYSEENYKLDGDIFISLEDAYTNSKKYNVTFRNEIIRLIVHGILHLLGYDDRNKNNRKAMKRIENRLVDKQDELLKKIK
ncbi:MAG: rRNA maturation RNase YbeY [Ignavibacteria bacterium RBG_13_36_8]|nr:MAG: rRNA maturation RNase YbeY [Ignavibacteria bacterium RBG_13_36_8]